MYRIKQIPEDFLVREDTNIELSENGSHTYLRLKKANMNTEEAIEKIAEVLKAPRKRFGYSGTKDKRAVTEQFISFHGRLSKGIKLENLSAEAIGYGNEKISLGFHLGNNFEITVRNLGDNDLKNLRRNISRIKKNNLEFLNLFDEQRFSKRNDKIGHSIVKGDFKKAAGLVLEGSGKTEAIVRDYLQKSPKDYIGAMRRIPKKILLMYVHALQSRLWNSVAERMKNEREKISIPLVGFATEFNNKKIGKEYESLMKKFRLGRRDFIIRNIPRLSSEGSERKLFAKIRKFKLGKLESDELNNGMKKIKIGLYLEKGSYATIAIKELFSQNRKALP